MLDKTDPNFARKEAFAHAKAIVVKMSIPYLSPEDYLEPVCPLCDDPFGKKPRQIPIGRVIEKLDHYIDCKDVEGAIRHLDYWYEEAHKGRDEGGMLTILNEKMGVYRNAERPEEALKIAYAAQELTEKMHLDADTVLGTTYLNIGTVLSAVGKAEKAVNYYEKAEKIYLSTLEKGDARFGGLYNNKAVALARTGRYSKARAAYEKALEVMKGSKYEHLERALTYTNLANLSELELGMEEGETEISGYLLEAQKLLDRPDNPIIPYTAYVYEKCAPTFGYYGWFIYADELEKRAQKIYEGANR